MGRVIASTPRGLFATRGQPDKFLTNIFPASDQVPMVLFQNRPVGIMPPVSTGSFLFREDEEMKKLCLVATITALSASSVSALEAHYSKDTPAPAAKAWATVGSDFCGIASWHPAVEYCELSQKDGVTQRTLTLKGGGTILEQLVEQDDKTMSQTYVILEGVLPVANYKSTLKVVPKGEGSTYDWVGTFDAKGAKDAEAVKTITGVYTDGVDALVAKTSK